MRRAHAAANEHACAHPQYACLPLMDTMLTRVTSTLRARAMSRHNSSCQRWGRGMRVAVMAIGEQRQEVQIVYAACRMSGGCAPNFLGVRRAQLAQPTPALTKSPQTCGGPMSHFLSRRLMMGTNVAVQISNTRACRCNVDMATTAHSSLIAACIPDGSLP